MARNKIGSIVVTEKGKAIGIITERDIVRKIVAQCKSPKLELEKAMTTPLKVIEDSRNIKEAISLMKKYGVKRLPVLDAQKRLVGIVTETDITRAVPGMMDLVAELAQVRPWEPGAEGVGICGKCGTWSETLINVNGELLCEECREEEEERE
jgi:signal-transduction protein with cAMP-binding, CBS, and nucleotidyltransferase domain